MRKKLKIFLFSMMAMLLLFSSAFLRSPPKNVLAEDSDSLYTKKVVAVVYDNSGSMNTGGWSPYAKYALQGLISIFDSNDLMSIFPLNRAERISVELNENVRARKDAIYDVFKYPSNNSNKLALDPQGTTSPLAMETAINWLKDNEMNTLEPIKGKEYWLIVLSDGAFDPGVKVFNKTFGSNGFKTTNDLLTVATDGYIGLQTFYFGMGTSAGIEDTPSLTAEEVNNKDDVIDAMQEVANRVTGRYTLQSGVAINGNKVSVDLSECNFSISSLAVLAQGESSLSLTDVSCSSIQLKNIRASSMSVDEEVTVNHVTQRIQISGYSSTIVPVDLNGYLNKDVVTLTFNTAPTTVSILVEPSIKLDSWLQYKNGSDWEDVDVDTINTSFKKDALVRTRYKLLDGKTGKNLTNVIGSVETSVSYAGSSFGYDDGFKLKTGKNETALSVTVKIGDSSYVLYNSWLCDIDENPNSFKVVADQKTNGDTVTVDYKVYYDDVQLKKSDFDSKFKWELVELKDPQGNDVSPISAEINSSGLISIVYKTKFGQFGSYVNKIKVICQENKRYRFGESELPFYPNSLTLSSSQSGGMTLTTKQVEDNVNAIEFFLTASGQPLNFNSSVIGYELKVDGVDKTKSTKLDGSVLKFIPNSDTLSSQMMKAGDRNVELKVWSTKDSGVNATATCKLSIIESTYLIEVTEENTQVDIYDINKSKSKILFRINLDGEYLTAKELKDGLNSGEIKLSYNKFGWELLLPPTVTTEVVEMGRDAYIVCSLGTTWWKPLASLVSSFIITGDKTLTLSVGGCSNVGAFSLTPVGILSRIWRWLVIIAILYTILHIVLWIIGFFIAKPIPKGIISTITLKRVNMMKVDVTAKPVNHDKKLIFKWHLKRFIPFKEFINQPPIKASGVEFSIDESTKASMMKFKSDVSEFSIPKAPISAFDTVLNYRKKCRAYKGKKGKKPKLDNPITTGDMKNIIVDKGRAPVKAKTKMGVTEKYFATKDDKGVVKEIIFFINSN